MQTVVGGQKDVVCLSGNVVLCALIRIFNCVQFLVWLRVCYGIS